MMIQSGFYTVINTMMTVLTIIIFIVLALLLLAQRKGYNRLIFMLHARSLKLHRKYISILESLIKNYHPSQPYEVFRNGSIFNNLLKQAFLDLEQDRLSEEEKTNLRFDYFKLKHLMEVKNSVKQTINTTKNLPREGKILIAPLNNSDWFFQATIKGQRGENFIIKLNQPKFNEPHAQKKKSMVWTRGLKLKAIYLDRQHTEYLFKTSIISIASNSNDPALLCSYSGDLTKVRRRNYRRNDTQINATITLISHNDGLVKVDSKAPCIITNISLGGCALTTRKKIEPLATICLQFTIANEDITCYGKVVHCEYQGLELSARVKFTRATKASLNAINTLIYKF